MTASSSPESHESPAPARTNSWFNRIGFGSLSISLIVHGLLLLVGSIWIWTTIHDNVEKRVDFMPPSGGGGGTPGQTVSAQKMRAPQLSANPQRVFAQGVTSTFTLDQTEDLSTFSTLESITSGGLSGGLGGTGSGGGKGDGNGRGFGGGTGLGIGGSGGSKPFAGMMFGNEVAAKSIGVVLDVSGSMLPHLPKVIQELDRVAEGSPLVLYVGCGIGSGRAVERSYSTIDIEEKRFERFWRLTHDPAYADRNTLEKGSARIKVDFSTPIPKEPIFRILANRKNTAYIDYQGTKFAWTALLAKELRDVEAVYWFADFQDPVEEDEAKDVMHRLRGKKQKLYLHASVEGNSFALVRDLIALPTKGAVINAK